MANPSAALCALCAKRPPESAYKPFCSKRCADLDLQRWFTGRYATPAVTPPGAEGDDED